LLYLNGLTALVMIVLGWYRPRLGDRSLGHLEGVASRFAARKRTMVLTVAFATIGFRLALLWAFPVPVPAVHDEFSYLLAADTFAQGRLTNPPHPMGSFFDTFHVLQHPSYASIYPPAQGAVLALGELLGRPWIGVLLSMAAMCAAITWMLQGWLPPNWALLGGVLVLLRLGLTSYWMNTYWGGAAAAIGGALVLGALPRIVRGRRLGNAFWMAIGAGLLANSRPVEGLIFCLPVAVAMAAWLFSSRSPALRITARQVILPVAALLGLTAVFLLYYDWRITGDPFLPPHLLYQRQYWGDDPLLVWQRQTPPRHYANPQFETFFNMYGRTTHDPPREELLRVTYLKMWNWWYFFLGIPFSIPFVTLPWLLCDRRLRLILIQFALCALGLLAVVFFHPHYAAPLTATMAVMLTQAMRHLRRWKIRGRPVGVLLTRAVVLLSLLSVLVFAGSRRSYGVPEEGLKRAQIVRYLESTPGEHLVLVHYAPDHNPKYEWVYNRADIDHAKIVWAREVPGQDLAPLLEYFRGRKVWEVEADTSPVDIHLYQAARKPNQARLSLTSRDWSVTCDNRCGFWRSFQA